ncbi:MAG: hypothetical protein ACI9R3_000214 [Verrucomicrobiales bacterium]|jgi:hypothetical protein
MNRPEQRSAIGRYNVAEELDHHPFGLTFKVVDPESQCYVGLKTFFDHEEILRNGLAIEIVKELANPRASDCLLSYYRIHPVRPNLPSDEDRPLLITEWIEGITVQELLRIRRTLTLPEITQLLEPVASAIEKNAAFAAPSLDQIMIAPLSSEGSFLPLESAVAALRSDLTEWSQMLIKIDPIGRRLPQPIDHSGGQTAVAPPWPARMKPSALQRIAYLSYLLLGGRPLMKENQRLTQIPELGESKNDLLHQAVRGIDRHVSTATQFIAAMRLP